MRRCEFCESPVAADATVCPVCGEEIAEETLERVLPMLKRPAAPDVRVLSTAERLWGVLRRPNAAYRDIAQRPDYFGPFVVILANALILAGFFLTISSKFTTTVIVNVTTGETARVSVLLAPAGVEFVTTALLSILPNAILGFVYFAIGTVFAHLAFKVTGGLGRKGKTAAVVGYSMLPLLLFRLVALLYVFLVMPTYSLGTTPSPEIISSIFQSDMWTIIDYMTTVSFVWVGFLLIFGIREAHNTSTGWATLVAIACMLVLTWTFWQAH
jgi:hypothetical protein